MAAEPAQDRSVVKLGPRGPDDKGREAMVELRARRVRLARPSSLTEAQAATDVLDASLQPALEVISKTLEGCTAR